MGGAGPHQPKGKNQISLEKPMSWQLWYTLASWLIQQDSASSGYTASRHHNWGCLWACKNPCPVVIEERWASTSLQMRDEFRGCNRHNVQSHLKQAYYPVSHFLYDIVSVGSGTCKQTFLHYAQQNINCPRPIGTFGTPSSKFQRQLEVGGSWTATERVATRSESSPVNYFLDCRNERLSPLLAYKQHNNQRVWLVK